MQLSESSFSQESLNARFKLMQLLSNENEKSAEELILDLQSSLDPLSVRHHSSFV